MYIKSLLIILSAFVLQVHAIELKSSDGQQIHVDAHLVGFFPTLEDQLKDTNHHHVLETNISADNLKTLLGFAALFNSLGIHKDTPVDVSMLTEDVTRRLENDHTLITSLDTPHLVSALEGAQFLRSDLLTVFIANLIAIKLKFSDKAQGKNSIQAIKNSDNPEHIRQSVIQDLEFFGASNASKMPKEVITQIAKQLCDLNSTNGASCTII